MNKRERGPPHTTYCYRCEKETHASSSVQYTVGTQDESRYKYDRRNDLFSGTPGPSSWRVEALSSSFHPKKGSTGGSRSRLEYAATVDAVRVQPPPAPTRTTEETTTTTRRRRTNNRKKLAAEDPTPPLDNLQHLQRRAMDVAQSFGLLDEEDFDPAFEFFQDSHVQTILGFFWRDWAAYVPSERTVPYMIRAALVAARQTKKKQQDDGNSNNIANFWDKRERIETPDGDWFHADTKYCDLVDDDDDDNDDNGLRPLVILLHGLNSNSESGVSTDLARAFVERGMDCTCLNFRGCSGEPNDTLLFYHLGFTEDVRHYLELLKQKNSSSSQRQRPIYLAGFSLGANAALKSLGELGSRAVTDYNIAGAAVACAPLDQVASTPVLQQPGIHRNVYTRNLLNGLKERAELARQRFGSAHFDYPRAMAATTIPEFDDAFTAQIYGFRDVWDYYNKTSSIHYLKDIAVPTLILNAEDDPFFDSSVWPIDVQGHAPLQMLRTAFGGHLGFSFHRVADPNDERLIQLDNDDGDDDDNNNYNGRQQLLQPAPSWAARQVAHFARHVEEHGATQQLRRDRDRYQFYKRTSVFRFSNFRSQGDTS